MAEAAVLPHSWLSSDSPVAALIRNFDWAATPLGSIEQWPPALRTAVTMVLDHPFPMVLLCGSEHITLYNDAYRLFLEKKPESLGRPFLEVWSEVRDIIAPQIARAMAGDACKFHDAPFLLRRGDRLEEAFFDYSLSPVRDESGLVVAVLHTAFETTHRVLTGREEAVAAQALHESEGRLRALVTAGTDLLYRMSPDWRVMYHLDGSSLAATMEPIEDWGEKYILEEDRPLVFATIDEAVQNKTLFELEHRVRLADGNIGWVLSRAVPIIQPDGSILEWLGTGRDMTQRKRAEAKVALLEQIGKDLALLSTPGEIMQTVGARVAGFLEVSGCVFADVDQDLNEVNVHYGWMRDDVPDLRHSFRVEDYLSEEFSRAGQSGETFLVRDTARDPRTNAEGYANLKIGAFIIVNFRWRGRWTAYIGITNVEPRDWRADEEELLVEVANRIFPRLERARAEQALRASEERFRQFSNASSCLLWIRNAETLDMENLSAVFETIYGAPPHAVMGDVRRWAALVVPDDRERAVDNIERVQSGVAVIHEFRVRRPSDGTFRWLRDTVFPLLDDTGAVTRIAGISSDVTEVKLSGERQEILLAELQHRVRNILAMIRAVGQRTERSAASVHEYAELMSGRIMSLARTQALLTRAANTTVKLNELIAGELDAQVHDRTQYSLSGPTIELSPKVAEVLSLAIHELSTNALKYGALAISDGSVKVEWQIVEIEGRQWLSLQWSENHPVVAEWAPPTRRGFGTELVERRVPYELEGRGQVEITAEGARVSIEFPLRGGASILETSAPLRRRIFGGSVDMMSEPSLAGLRILVLEDDYLLAYDIESALSSAGAEVVGPFSRESAAIHAIERGNLHGAVTDINLGAGPSFEAARMLRQQGIPFIFFTGYGQSAIPEEFREVPCFGKPVDTRDVVREFARSAHRR
jgi:PAS domain S-box-containing protein